MLKRSFAILAVALLLTPICLFADTGIRECIYELPSGTQAMELPANGNWYVLGQSQFNHDTAESSDYVVAATVFFSKGNTAGSLVEYQFLLDGAPYGYYSKAIPENYPSSQTIRGSIADQPNGVHTIGIRVRNISTHPVRYSGFWISTLLLPGSESTWGTSTATPVTAGTTFVDLITLNVTTASDRQYLLEPYLTVSSGTANTQLKYRLLRNGVTLYTFTDSVNPTLPNATHFSYIDTGVNSGAVTYTLQARSTSGTVTIGSRGMAVQASPRYTVLQGSSGLQTFANDDQWHTATSSGWVPVSPLSVGTWGTNGFGSANTTFSGPLNAETSNRFMLQALQEGWAFEVGWFDLHPTGRTKLEILTSDWEQLGLVAGRSYKIDRNIDGLCEGSTSNIELTSDEFQIMLLPDNFSYYNGSCTYPCTVYSCTVGSLSVVTVPARSCF